MSAISKAASAVDADGAAALPYLHEFVTLRPQLRVVVVMGGFAERWWLRYVRRPENPVLAAEPRRSQRTSPLPNAVRRAAGTPQHRPCEPVGPRRSRTYAPPPFGHLVRQRPATARQAGAAGGHARVRHHQPGGVVQPPPWST